MNIFKANINNGVPQIGTLLTTSSGEIAELTKRIGFDWVFIDMEHGSIDPQSLVTLLQCLNNGPAALVRIPENSSAWFKRVLDAGANGVIVPLVNNADQARQAVSYAKYPPIGSRSVGIGRAHGYGMDFSSYVEHANESVCLIIQIEHIDGVANLEEILSVPGIDAVFIGPYDLSGSMNLLGQIQNPDVQTAISKVRAECLKQKVPVGAFSMKQAGGLAEIAAGCTFVAVGTDLSYFSSAATETLQSLKQPLK